MVVCLWRIEVPTVLRWLSPRHCLPARALLGRGAEGVVAVPVQTDQETALLRRLPKGTELKHQSDNP